jgi:hypothetical protein
MTLGTLSIQTIKLADMKPSPELLSHDNHALVLFDFEDQMAFVTKCAPYPEPLIHLS